MNLESQAYYPEEAIPPTLAEYEGDDVENLTFGKSEVTPLLIGNEFDEFSQFPTLQIRNLPEALALFQGGMGLKISNGEMAGQVAAEGGFGTVTAVQFDMQGKGNSVELNRIAFAREIQHAISVANGNGVVGVNIMNALGDYKGLVETALKNLAIAHAEHRNMKNNNFLAKK